MKGKTKKRLKNVVLWLLVAVFVAGTLLLYLPITQPAPETEPPAIEDIPDAQNQPVPVQNGAGAGVPADGTDPNQAVPIGP